MRKIFMVVGFLIVLSSSVGAQWCNPSFSIGCTSSDYINDFSATSTLASFTNNNTGCTGTTPGVVTYYNLTAAGLPGDFVNVSMQAGSAFSQGFRIWVDWDNNFSFSAGESVFVTTTWATTIFTGSFTIPVGTVPGVKRMRVMCRYNTVPTATDACTTTTMSFGEVEDYNLQVISPVPCSGTPSAGTIVGPDTVNVCPTQPHFLSTTGTSALANLTYIWEQQPLSTGVWSIITGAPSQPNYSVPAGTAPASYRLVVLCNNSFNFDTSNVVTVIPQLPKKATVPYAQSFESWMSYCNVSDVPDDSAWTNSNSIGNLSWRRNDQGSTAGWANPANGIYLPPANHLAHSARLHSYQAAGIGNLDLHLDLSTVPGTKTLNFDYIIDAFFANIPELEVLLSSNGGATFTSLGVFDGSLVNTWQTISLPIVSNSNDAILRFSGNCASSFYGDIGLDNLQLLAPCSGTPTAGIIVDTTACPADSFALSLSGNVLAGGLSYDWQSAPSASGPWSTFATTTQALTNAAQNSTTYYRCVVTCSNSGASTTTPVIDVLMNPFYYCYCRTSQPQVGGGDYLDIGNVFIQTASAPIDTIIWNAFIASADTFNNSAAINGYTNWQFSLPVKQIKRDSTYLCRVTDMTQYSWNPGADSKIYIDYNRDGIFQTSEAATGGSNATGTIFNGSFTVPGTASPGITGLRVISNTSGSSSSIDPCGNNNYWTGETEDYLVEILMPTCQSPISAGTLYANDSLICPGYDIVMVDTSYTSPSQFAGLTRLWQRSVNGGITWNTIAGAISDTFVATPSVNTVYRVALVCVNGDTAYSNTHSVNVLPSNTCYPASGAFWSTNDTTDNGAFGIGNYLFTAGGGGPHVGNPAAIRTRTDLSTNPAYIIDLFTDSTYEVSFYNIIKPYNHADAKITMFIDYNGDLLYQPASERVFSGISGPLTFVLNGSFVTPVNPILNTPTGLRVILNSNTGPNVASDAGIGLFTSGETEDYRVRFKKKPIFPTGVGTLLDFNDVLVYPNPSTGMLFIDVQAKNLANLNVIVTAVTGQEVFRAGHQNIDGKFSTSIDLSSLAKGTYMVKLQSEKGSVVRNIVVH
jgi:GEVED domain/Secretion system C-terminal sorting domain